MLSIHHVRNIKANTLPGANWVEITFESGLDAVVLTIYTESNSKFDGSILIEALTEAINGLPKVKEAIHEMDTNKAG